jgi:hypothetical protein
VTFGVLNLVRNQILRVRCAAMQFGRSDARYCSYSHICTVFRSIDWLESNGG